MTKIFMFVSSILLGHILIISSSLSYAAPISITIEDSGGSKGVDTRPQVEKIYENRKEQIEKKFDEVNKTVKDKEEKELVVLAHDTVDCMDRSVNGFPLLVDIIDGQKMNAYQISNIMEENCVLDVLVHVKRDLPEKLDKAKLVYKKLGFDIPESDLEGF